MKNSILIIGLTLILCFQVQNNTQAQCAMCRATVESSANTLQGKGKGVNTGILYLMVIPYIMAAGIAYFWYKHSKKETARLNKVEDVLKRRLA